MVPNLVPTSQRVTKKGGKKFGVLQEEGGKALKQHHPWISFVGLLVFLFRNFKEKIALAP